MGPLIVIMGVSGCGKSTIGQKLAVALSAQFLEGDDFHPPANIEKMTSGSPLTDDDRAAWLDAILAVASHSEAPAIVLACSALTLYVQERLISGAARNVIWVWLSAPQSVIAKRLKNRGSHFMPPALLESQYSALSPPESAIEINVNQDLHVVISEIFEFLSALPLDNLKYRPN